MPYLYCRATYATVTPLLPLIFIVYAITLLLRHIALAADDMPRYALPMLLLLISLMIQERATRHMMLPRYAA